VTGSAVLLGLVAVALAVLPAAAHAVLIEASPAPRARLGRPPARVTLTFSERLEPAYATVSVWSEEGRRVDLGDSAVGAGDPRRLSVSLPPLAPGGYAVRYRVLSVDGHVVEASYSFTVTGGAR
jgi:methionine-rich copper-binding protein CopC